jgi:3-oxoacyl-[acyl-carrier-protein] synthase III
LPIHCLAFDVSLGCSGYVYGMWMAHQFIAGGTCKRILLLAGDTISQLRSPQDKSVALLFGDAGSATAFEADTGSLSSFVLGTDGSGAEQLCVPAGGFRERVSDEAQLRSLDENDNFRARTELFMDGIAIFNFTNSRVPLLVNEVLEQQGWSHEVVDAFLFHQANGFILKKIANKLKLPPDRVPLNIGKYGNTSMATIPLLLADELSERLTRSESSKLVMAGFGVGYSWAGAAVEIGNLQVAQVLRV